MSTKQIAIIATTLLGLSGMFAWLESTGAETEGFAALIVGAIIPTIAGMFAAKRAGEARDFAQRAEHNTNGTLSALMKEREELRIENERLKHPTKESESSPEMTGENKPNLKWKG